MEKRTGIGRAPRTGMNKAAACAWLRASLVAASSTAILVALPGWLRHLEARPVRSPELSFAHPSSPVGSPPAPAAAPTQAATHAVASSSSKEALRYQVLADFLSKRYRVSRDALERFVRLAYAAGQSTKIDPLLIIAVMAVESSFNPIAESVVGAKGLMQIIPEYHRDKLTAPHGELLDVLDPEVNIIAGAKVLREYTIKTGDDLHAALRLYGGVGSDFQHPYPNRILTEREKLEQVVRKIQDRPAPPTTTASASNI